VRRNRVVEHMLTTVDNPYDPFTQFDEWLEFDERAGYNTIAFLGRVIRTSDDLSEEDQSLAIELAIDEIVSENVLGLYRKVVAVGVS
jgi:hypothetical protein